MKKSRKKFYAYFLPVTKEQGITENWPECQAKTRGVSRAKFLSFDRREDAEKWLAMKANDEQARIKHNEIRRLERKDFVNKVVSKTPNNPAPKLPAKEPINFADYPIEVNFDGACEPKNPGGTASYGWVVKKSGEIIDQDAQIIGTGEGMTNNVAEYTGLIKALEFLQKQKIKDKIVIRGDSNIVCNTVSKEWGWKNKKKEEWTPHRNAPHLAVLLEKVLKLLAPYEFVVEWVPREKNQQADDLSKKPLIEMGIITLDTETKKCKECGANLVKRKGYDVFYGCSKFPKCRYSEKA
ncbi:MAG: viroplasmin family protein [Candidatus Liptonbacteria bacterium]|nr:viroplasmin family protein [Candidatus Liptonbacteria bacterium]